MITYVATTTDVTRFRFSPSPISEAVYSFRMLGSPERRRRHQLWVDEVGPRLRTVDFRPLRAVVPPIGYVPDFLTPAPGHQLLDFDADLEVVRSTDAERFIDEVSWMAADTRAPRDWSAATTQMHRKMLTEPEHAIKVVADLLGTYWRLALAPYWKRIHGWLQADINSRMKIMENVGGAGVFSSLNERIGWSGDKLTVRSSYEFQEDLGGQGLVLTPSVFCGPDVMTMLPPLQPMVVYPKQADRLWDPENARNPSPLAALLGSVRAGVLETLVTPSSTTDLAGRLGVTPGAVSQHLGVLRGCDLVIARRVGRRVIYSHTATGEALVLASATQGRDRQPV